MIGSRVRSPSIIKEETENQSGSINETTSESENHENNTQNLEKDQSDNNHDDSDSEVTEKGDLKSGWKQKKKREKPKQIGFDCRNSGKSKKKNVKQQKKGSQRRVHVHSDVTEEISNEDIETTEMEEDEKVLVGKNKVNLDNELTKLEKNKKSKRHDNFDFSDVFSLFDPKVNQVQESSSLGSESQSSTDTFLTSEDDEDDDNESNNEIVKKSKLNNALEEILKDEPRPKTKELKRVSSISPKVSTKDHYNNFQISKKHDSLEEDKIHVKQKKSLKKLISLDFDLPPSTRPIADNKPVMPRSPMKENNSSSPPQTKKSNIEKVKAQIIKTIKSPSKSPKKEKSIEKELKVPTPPPPPLTKTVKFHKINIGSPPPKLTENVQKSAAKASTTNSPKTEEQKNEENKPTIRRISSAESSSSSSSGAELYVNE